MYERKDAIDAACQEMCEEIAKDGVYIGGVPIAEYDELFASLNENLKYLTGVNTNLTSEETGMSYDEVDDAIKTIKKLITNLGYYDRRGPIARGGR